MPKLWSARLVLTMATWFAPSAVFGETTLVPNVSQPSSPSAIVIAAGGKWLAIVRNQSAAELWDVASHTLCYSTPFPATNVAFSPDGKILACVEECQFRGEDADYFPVIFYDCVRGQVIRTIKLNSDNSVLDNLCLSPDNKSAVIATGDSLTIWNYRSGEELHSTARAVGFEHPIAFSRDGTTLAIGSTAARSSWSLFDSASFVCEQIDIWNVAAWRLTRTLVFPHTVDWHAISKGLPPSVKCAAFAPDGRSIAIATDNRPGSDIEIWNFKTGEKAASIGHSNSTLVSLAYSGDGNAITAVGWDATYAASNASFYRWDTRTHKLLVSRHAGGPSIPAALSPDGQFIASADDTCIADEMESLSLPVIYVYAGGDDITVYHFVNGRAIQTIPGNSVNESGCAFSRDGATLYETGSVRLDRSKLIHSVGEISAWDIRTGQLKYQDATDNDVFHEIAPVGADSRVLLNDYRSSFWTGDLSTRDLRKLQVTVPEFAHALSDASPDGSRIAVACSVTKDIEDSPGTKSYTVDFVGGKVDIFDAVTAAKLRTIVTGDPVPAAVRFTPNSKNIIVITSESMNSSSNELRPGKVELFDVASGALLSHYPLDVDFERGVWISPNARNIITANTVYDAATGKQRGSLPTPDLGAPGIAFSADSRRVATHIGDVVRVWDAASLKPIQSWNIHVALGRDGLALSPDGRQVASLDDSGALRLWDVKTGRLCVTMRQMGVTTDSGVRSGWLTDTPDGYCDGDDFGMASARWTEGGIPVTSPALVTAYHRPDKIQLALAGQLNPSIYRKISGDGPALRSKVGSEIASDLAALKAKADQPASGSSAALVHSP